MAKQIEARMFEILNAAELRGFPERQFYDESTFCCGRNQPWPSRHTCMILTNRWYSTRQPVLRNKIGETDTNTRITIQILEYTDIPISIESKPTLY